MIRTLPTLKLFATPELFIVATAMLEELQVTAADRSCVLPSVNVPLAVNCCFAPNVMEGFPGETCSALRVFGGGVLDPPPQPANSQVRARINRTKMIGSCALGDVEYRLGGLGIEAAQPPGLKVDHYTKDCRLIHLLWLMQIADNWR